MRQFDVYPNPSVRSREAAPYVVVLQSHFLAATPTTVVAPLLIDDDRSAYSEASVKIVFGGERYVLSIPELAGIEPSRLGRRSGAVTEYDYEIRRALDRLFTGF
ncbi:MAG TPA: CcdB family protein [Phenylobacterium sp.]|uniref:CcdB family protein n=1 Tax=Phenylobacterium sp. TaxID=1871053 RepID=UPI002C915AF3|nr:CcdB family protein [Phenylobacterium sp.]HXA40078.1 CcdB family protein [Phenylobacterium sp.]